MARKKPAVFDHWQDELADLTRRYDAAEPKRGDRDIETDLHEQERARCVERLAELLDERAEEIVGWLLDVAREQGTLRPGSKTRERLIADAIGECGDRINLANRAMGTYRAQRERARDDEAEIARFLCSPMPVTSFVGLASDAPTEEPDRPIVLPDGSCVAGKLVARIVSRCPTGATIRIESRPVDRAHTECGISSLLVIEYHTTIGRGRFRIVGQPGVNVGLLPEHVGRADELARMQRESTATMERASVARDDGRTKMVRFNPADLAQLGRAA